MMMTRYKLTIEYDGTPYCGWQRQEDEPSVQQAIEEAIKGLCGQPYRLFGAGRTDSGVHATGQVAHCDLPFDPVKMKGDLLRKALNAHLRYHPIAILEAEPVHEDFDARFSATMRFYRYIILNRRAPAAIEKKRVWWVSRPLHCEHMQEAANALIGHHDFTSFRASQCQAQSPVKSLTSLHITRDHEHIFITTSAPSYLHSQVRSFVGTLKRIGEGYWPPEKMKEILEARDRKTCGPVAPPDGLYLTKVLYEKKPS